MRHAPPKGRDQDRAEDGAAEERRNQDRVVPAQLPPANRRGLITKLD